VESGGENIGGPAISSHGIGCDNLKRTPFILEGTTTEEKGEIKGSKTLKGGASEMRRNGEGTKPTKNNKPPKKKTGTRGLQKEQSLRPRTSGGAEDFYNG